MQKAASDKTKLAEEKLASVRKLEEENAQLKTALDEANKEVTRLKKDKGALTDKVEDLTRKRNELEVYLGGLAEKLFLMLEATFPCPNDLLASIHHKTVDSLFLCECRIPPKLRGRDWANQDKLGPHQLSHER